MFPTNFYVLAFDMHSIVQLIVRKKRYAPEKHLQLEGHLHKLQETEKPD